MAEQTILEENIRAELRITREELASLRENRLQIDATVRDLVAREKTLKRLAGVYDRANAKKAKTAESVAEVRSGVMIVGVDPGQTGALVLLESDGTFVTAAPMPGFGAEPSAADFGALIEAMGTPADLFIGIEAPFANNRASSVAQLNQGVGFGILLGVIGALGYRHERIRPADWKRGLGLPMSKDLTYAMKKKNSRIWASRLWPEEAHRWTKTNSDGVAEAALIGEYMRRRLLGEGRVE